MGGFEGFNVCRVDREIRGHLKKSKIPPPLAPPTGGGESKKQLRVLGALTAHVLVCPPKKDVEGHLATPPALLPARFL